MDFVSREEFDAVKTMAGKAREEAEDLKARVEALEGKIAKCPCACSAGCLDASRLLSGPSPQGRRLGLGWGNATRVPTSVVALRRQGPS